MGLKIYGILAAQNPDNVGETIKIDGLDDHRLGPIIDEHHDEPSMFDHVGAVTFHRKILSDRDCENDRQKRCWENVKVPFLYIEGELADGTNHPNADSAAALIKFTQRPDIPLSIGFSVDGGIVQRLDEQGRPNDDGKVIAKSIALRAAITAKPCNPKCRLWTMNDLQKSDIAVEPPTRYLELLHKSQSSVSIRHNTELMLHFKLDTLRKSIKDYFTGMTSMKCNKCGTGVRFFKSAKTLPNGCEKCGNHFSMSQLWKALNKTN